MSCSIFLYNHFLLNVQYSLNAHLFLKDQLLLNVHFLLVVHLFLKVQFLLNVHHPENFFFSVLTLYT